MLYVWYVLLSNPVWILLQGIFTDVIGCTIKERWGWVGFIKALQWLQINLCVELVSSYYVFFTSYMFTFLLVYFDSCI